MKCFAFNEWIAGDRFKKRKYGRSRDHLERPTLSQGGTRKATLFALRCAPGYRHGGFRAGPPRRQVMDIAAGSVRPDIFGPSANNFKRTGSAPARMLSCTWLRLLTGFFLCTYKINKNDTTIQCKKAQSISSPLHESSDYFIKFRYSHYELLHLFFARPELNPCLAPGRQKLTNSSKVQWHIFG